MGLRMSQELRRIVEAVLILNLLSLVMLSLRVIATSSTRHGYIPWNLLLTWVPFGLSLALVQLLQSKQWRHWKTLLAGILWLIFLPNTWYVLSDYIHVYPTGEVSQLYDIILISTLVISGFTLGFTSLYIVHKQFIKRFGLRRAHVMIALTLLISSFAIYLGRDLRWNTWDVLTDPAGLIVNVSDRIIDPLGHPRALTVTGLFFSLLSVMYLVIYRVISVADSSRRGN